MSENFKQKEYEKALVDGYFKIDEDLDKDWGKDEIMHLKKKNPPNKSAIFKLLGDMQNKDGAESG